MLHIWQLRLAFEAMAVENTQTNPDSGYVDAVFGCTQSGKGCSGFVSYVF